MSSVLMTSTMKSEPGMPGARAATPARNLRRSTFGSASLRAMACSPPAKALAAILIPYELAHPDELSEAVVAIHPLDRIRRARDERTVLDHGLVLPQSRIEEHAGAVVAADDAKQGRRHAILVEPARFAHAQRLLRIHDVDLALERK